MSQGKEKLSEAQCLACVKPPPYPQTKSGRKTFYLSRWVVVHRLPSTLNLWNPGYPAYYFYVKTKAIQEKRWPSGNPAFQKHSPADHPRDDWLLMTSFQEFHLTFVHWLFLLRFRWIKTSSFTLKSNKWNWKDAQMAKALALLQFAC